MTRELTQLVRQRLHLDDILSVDGTQHRIRTIDISTGGLSIAMASS